MMPARGLRLRCRLLTLIAVGVVVPAGAKAQSSVTLKATVSETVVLSVAPNAVDAVSDGNIVRVTVSGSSVVRVPLIVRSNTGFKISANFESNAAGLSELSVVDVRATGRLVSPQVVNALQVESQLDPQPLFVVSGPRVSLGGTLHSPNNALQITVLVRLKPDSTFEPVRLSFVISKQL